MSVTPDVSQVEMTYVDSAAVVIRRPTLQRNLCIVPWAMTPRAREVAARPTMTPVTVDVARRAANAADPRTRHIDSLCVVVHAQPRSLVEGSCHRTARSFYSLDAQSPMSWLKAEASEHVRHRRDAGGVPRADVLVEGRLTWNILSIVEVTLAGVPRADVFVEGRAARVVRRCNTHANNSYVRHPLRPTSKYDRTSTSAAVASRDPAATAVLIAQLATTLPVLGRSYSRPDTRPPVTSTRTGCPECRPQDPPPPLVQNRRPGTSRGPGRRPSLPERSRPFSSSGPPNHRCPG